MGTKKLIVAIILLLNLTSCGSYYRMTSRIESDGSLYREVYAQGDSVFRAGDMTHNPFMFQLTDDWKLVFLGSTLNYNFGGAIEKLNVKVTRRLPLVDGEYFIVSKEKQYLCPLAIPREVLKKSFRWFYTYYSYTATYKELANKGPIPLNDYMSNEEQMIWFRGDNAAYNGLNGMDLKDKLDGLEAKFGKWYTRSYYELNWEVIRHFALLKGDSAYINRLDNLKNTVYEKFLADKDGWSNADPDKICTFFDELCRTKYYLELYQSNQKSIEDMCEEKIRDAELFYNAVQFELIMPGRLISSNATVWQDDLVVWKLDGFRLLPGNYVLTAESRVINYWAFGITLLVILGMLIGFVKLYRNKR